MLQVLVYGGLNLVRIYTLLAIHGQVSSRANDCRLQRPSYKCCPRNTSQSHFSAPQSLHLPRRKDGECVDALAGLDEPNSPLVIARRNEIWALDIHERLNNDQNDKSSEVINDQELASLEVKLRQLWSRPARI